MKKSIVLLAVALVIVVGGALVWMNVGKKPASINDPVSQAESSTKKDEKQADASPTTSSPATSTPSIPTATGSLHLPGVVEAGKIEQFPPNGLVTVGQEVVYAPLYREQERSRNNKRV